MRCKAVRLAQDPLGLAVRVQHDAIPSDSDEATRKQIKGSIDVPSWARGHIDLLMDDGSAHEMRNDVPEPFDLRLIKRVTTREFDENFSTGVFREKSPHLIFETHRPKDPLIHLGAPPI